MTRSIAWMVTLTLAGFAWSARLAAAADAAPQGSWKRLFNGRNLDGWEVVNAGNWTVEDGAIVMRRQPNETGGGWLVTRQDYGDFILRLKFKPENEHFNSGILIRDPGHAKTTRPALNGFEVKLAQGDRVENSNGTIWYAASAYLRPLPAEEWTDVEIRCIGDHIATFLDGHKMAETHSRRSYKGAIGLHLHGGRDQPEVRWKDIEIMELAPVPRGFQLMEEELVQAPGETRPLLDAVVINGGVNRVSGDPSAWKIDAGVLRGVGREGDKTVLTSGSYANFVLSFDFRISGQGDAGLLFRVPDASAPSGGYEFHVVDGDAVNPPASIVDVARAFMLDSNLQRIYHPGKWNQSRIYASGDHLVTYLNLEKELDVHDGRSREGRIGFRVGRDATVEFRNVTIKQVARAHKQANVTAGARTSR